MKPLRKKITRLLGLLFLPFAIASISAQENGDAVAEGEGASKEGEKITSNTGKFGNWLEGIGPRLFSADDGTSGIGIQWDRTITFAGGKGSFHTSGAWVFDEDNEALNQTPIVIEGRFGTYDAFKMAVPATPLMPTDQKLLGGHSGFSMQPITLDVGIQARYETDQSLDHSNGALSLFGYVQNPNIDSKEPWSFAPSVKLTVDAVFQNENATADAMGMDSEEFYGRVHASVDWLVEFNTLMDRMPLTYGSDLFNSWSIHAAFQYSYAFGDTEMLEATGQEQTFGGLIEMLIDPAPDTREILNMIGLPELTEDQKYYIGYSFGQFTPLPDSENRLVVGTRMNF